MNAVVVKLDEDGMNLDGRTNLVTINGYFLELYVSPVFNEDQVNYYQNLIGVLNWSV